MEYQSAIPIVLTVYQENGESKKVKQVINHTAKKTKNEDRRNFNYFENLQWYNILIAVFALLMQIT